MNGRNFYSFLVIWLVSISLSTYSLAQTITTGSFTPNSLCSGAGGTVTIPFTITGTFSTSNTFAAELSDATGTFAATPPVIGTLKSAVAGSISATVLAAIPVGTYKIRVVSDNPAKVGSTSAATLTISAATPPSVTTPSPYCQNDVASALIATASTGGTLNWYGLNQTGGTASPTAPTPSTSQAGVFTYYVSQTINNCESSRASIPVTVNSKPGSPGVSSLTLCQNSTSGPLSATPAPGAVLNWYGTSATGGTPSATAPTPVATTPGTTLYYVSQSVNGCEGPRTSIAVTVTSLPAAPVGNTPAPYCQGTGAAALSATGTGLLWYGPNATGGTPSSAPTVPGTGAAGTTTYYVTQTVNGCESPRAAIAVTVKPKPSVPGTAGVEFCQGATPPTLTASVVASATPNWYGTNATGGTASATAPTPSNATAGTTLYYVSQILDGCESDRASLSVRVKALPAAPGVTAISFCNNGPSAQLTANGSGLKWYDASDNLLSGTPTPNTGTVGDQIFKVSQTVESCEGAKATLTVTIKPLPAAPVGITPAPYCQGTGATSLSATGTGLLWYGPNATGGTSSPTPTIPSTSTPGTINYYVTQTVNGCESARIGIAVTVKPTPGAPSVSAVEFCQGSNPPVLAATLVSGATPNWYGTSQTGGTASATAPIPSNTTPGTTLYYVSQTLNGCEGGRTSLSVRVKALPSAPGVAAIGFCNNGPSSPLTANGQNIKWYDASDNLLGGAPTPGTGAVGDQIFKVSQTVESCEGPRATLTVTIKPLPQPPGVTNLNYCLPTTDQPAQNVQPLTAFGTELKWYRTDGSYTTVAPTPSINSVGVQSYTVSQTYNGCEGGKNTLLVTVGTTASPTVAKTLVTYCINDKAVPLEATAETGGSLRWVDPYNNVTNQAPTPYTLNTSIKPDGDPFYVYQVGQNGCYSERAIIKVLVNALPTLSLIPATTNVNLGQRVPMQLKFTSSAPYSYTLTGGYAGVVNRPDTTISILPRATTTYQVISVKNSCGVGLPGNPATATITVRVPTVTTSALTSSTLCAGTSISVPFTTTGEFNQGNLFSIELVSTADTTKKYAVSATATASPVTAPLPMTLVGGQYYVRVKADNPEIAITGSNSPSVLTVRPQPSASLTGNQNIYVGYPANLTLTLGGDSPWTVVYADSVRSYSATVTASPYLAEVRPTRTTTYQLVSVSNGCGTVPGSGSATVTVVPLLAVDDPLDLLVKTYPVPATSLLTIELDLPLSRTPAILSLTDMSGRPIMSATTRNKTYELDVAAQPNGLYLLRIQVGDRQTVRKILKQ
ncbi:Ig-like domain-containing protein [Spirosoma koreense]